MSFCPTRFLFGLVLVFGCLGIDSDSAHAQTNPSLENIYRTMAETQIQRDQQAAAYRQTIGGTAPGQLVQPPSVTKSINGQPPEWFTNAVYNIRQNVAGLAPQMQRYASSIPAVRDTIGDVYQISAEADSLFTRTRNGESMGALLAGYQGVDTRWRDISYRMRAGGGLDSNITNYLNAIDESFGQIDRQLGLATPIDRMRLRDLMIVTLTYMDAMFDDVRLSPQAFRDADSLIRDGRILRERLRQESYKIERADYNEVVASFTEFVRLWRTYATRLYQLNDAHVNQRLDSIRRQGDEVYASLRVPAATDRGQTQFAGQRLTAGLVALQDQMSRWGTTRLPADQLRFIDVVRSLGDRSRRLETELARSGGATAAAATFTEMDAMWTDGLRSMRAVDPRSGLQQSLVQTDTLFSEMRDLLKTGLGPSQSELLSTAASLEVVADDFNIDVQRYKRYLSPTGFRDSLSGVSDDIYAVSRDLHRALETGGNSREATVLAQRLVQRWQELTPMLSELNQRGLATNRTEQLYEGYREMQPLVARAASMLLY